MRTGSWPRPAVAAVKAAVALSRLCRPGMLIRSVWLRPSASRGCSTHQAVGHRLGQDDVRVNGPPIGQDPVPCRPSSLGQRERAGVVVAGDEQAPVKDRLGELAIARWTFSNVP